MGVLVDYDYDEVINFCENAGQTSIHDLANNLNKLSNQLSVMQDKFHSQENCGVIGKIYNGFSSIVGATDAHTGVAELNAQAAFLVNILYNEAKGDKQVLEGNYLSGGAGDNSAPSSPPVSKPQSPTPNKNPNWNGSVLTKKMGVNQGPNGKETYYNLNMSRVVENMHKQGYEGEYWVREDGVKMFGDYVIVAANLEVHPRGSIIESSLGKAIVCDTGGFAKDNPNQIDIATSW